MVSFLDQVFVVDPVNCRTVSGRGQKCHQDCTSLYYNIFVFSVLLVKGKIAHVSVVLFLAKQIMTRVNFQMSLTVGKQKNLGLL